MCGGVGRPSDLVAVGPRVCAGREAAAVGLVLRPRGQVCKLAVAPVGERRDVEPAFVVSGGLTVRAPRRKILTPQCSRSWSASSFRSSAFARSSWPWSRSLSGYGVAHLVLLYVGWLRSRSPRSSTSACAEPQRPFSPPRRGSTRSAAYDAFRLAATRAMNVVQATAAGSAQRAPGRPSPPVGWGSLHVVAEVAEPDRLAAGAHAASGPFGAGVEPFKRVWRWSEASSRCSGTRMAPRPRFARRTAGMVLSRILRRMDTSEKLEPVRDLGPGQVLRAHGH